VFCKLDGILADEASVGIKTIDSIHYSMGPFLFQRVVLRNQLWFKEIPEEYKSDLEGLDGVECNKDNILVHGKDQNERNQRLEAVLKRLVGADVTVSSTRH